MTRGSVHERGGGPSIGRDGVALAADAGALAMGGLELAALCAALGGRSRTAVSGDREHASAEIAASESAAAASFTRPWSSA